MSLQNQMNASNSKYSPVGHLISEQIEEYLRGRVRAKEAVRRINKHPEVQALELEFPEGTFRSRLRTIRAGERDWAALRAALRTALTDVNANYPGRYPASTRR